MAWQSPSANTGPSHDSNNGGQGNNGGGQNTGNGSQTVGTEYTLQGVMRFLQTEWHKHERDRNSWEIERAEMKARIAKLEGENRAGKRLQQGLMTRIKMLEIALKKKGGEGAEGLKTQSLPENSVQSKSPQPGPQTNALVLGDSPAIYRAEAARNKSRAYLEKCLQEITYLLTPPNHPPPQQQPNIDLNQILQQQQQQQQQHQQQQSQHQQQQQSHQQQLQQPSQAPNHQLPHPPTNHVGGYQPQPLPRSRAGSHPHLQPHEIRSEQQQQYLQGQQPQLAIPEPMVRDQSIEKSPSQVNASNTSPDTNPFTASLNEGSTSTAPSDGDGWDFDEATQASGDCMSGSNNISDEYELSNHHLGKPTNSFSRKKLSIRHRNDPGPITNPESGSFKVKFALRGHLDVVRAVIFTGGTANEPEICTAGDDGVLKRWYIPGSYGLSQGVSDMDIQSHFTHRGHQGMVTCLTACPPVGGEIENGLSEGGWIFSGGQDTTVRVWEANMVGPKATLVGHTDVVWAVCILPTSSPISGSPEERILLASGSGDGTVKIWSVTPPPPNQGSSSGPGSRRGSIRNVSSAPSGTSFGHSLISTIVRPGITASPTCITPFSSSGESFIVSYNDAAVIIYDTASGEEISQMMSHETYDGTPATGVNSVVASTISLDSGAEGGREEEQLVAGATGPKGGVAGIVITGHEDRYVRIFDANSGQCTYTMLAHPAAISSLSLSPDGRELVSAGHDASLRFWSMGKRSCTQEITSHRLMRGEGVCAVIWSADGRWVVSGGGDGVVKVFAR